MFRYWSTDIRVPFTCRSFFSSTVTVCETHQKKRMGARLHMYFSFPYAASGASSSSMDASSAMAAASAMAAVVSFGEFLL